MVQPRKTKPNASALRCLEILKLLKGRSLTGLTTSDIARALAISLSTASRDLATLVASGLVAQLDGDKYALSVAMLGIAEAHRLEMARARSRVDELDQRVSAAAR